MTDKGYAGAGIGVHSPIKGRDLDVWPFIRDLFTSSEPVAEGDKHALAETILSRVQLYPGLGPANEFPSPAEGTPTPGGGYVFWAQDYEFTRNVTPTDEAYAGVLAVMWAGKQILSDSMKIFPVPSSSLFKTLGRRLDEDPGGDPAVGSQRVAHLALEGVVVHGGGRRAEHVQAGLAGVGVDVADPAGQLHLQQGVESVLAL